MKRSALFVGNDSAFVGIAWGSAVVPRRSVPPVAPRWNPIVRLLIFLPLLSQLYPWLPLLKSNCSESGTFHFPLLLDGAVLIVCRTFSDVEVADLALKVRFPLSKSHRVGSPRCDPQERHLSSPHGRKIPAQEIPQGPGGRLRFCVMPSARLWSASRTASCSTAATPVRR